MCTTILSKISACDLTEYARQLIPYYKVGLEQEKAELEDLVGKLSSVNMADRCNKALRKIKTELMPELKKYICLLRKALETVSNDETATAMSGYLDQHYSSQMNYTSLSNMLNGFSKLETPQDRVCVVVLEKMQTVVDAFTIAMEEMHEQQIAIDKIGNNRKWRQGIVENIWRVSVLIEMDGSLDAKEAKDLKDMIATVCDKGKQSLAHRKKRKRGEEVEEEKEGEGTGDGEDGDEGNCGCGSCERKKEEWKEGDNGGSGVKTVCSEANCACDSYDKCDCYNNGEAGEELRE